MIKTDERKTMWIRTAKILALLIPVVLFILFMPVNNLDDTRRIQAYYLEEPDSLDVVVMGASDVYAGYSPVLAYEEYGFTSYSYVLSGNYLQLYAAQLEEILSTQSPELIVIEVTEASYDKGSDYDIVFRQFITGIPFSRHKIEMIREYGDQDQLLSYYFPFSVNHGNADLKTLADNISIDRSIRDRGYSLLKGSLTFTGSGENWDGPYVTPIDTSNDHSTAEIPAAVEENFHAFLSYCRDRSLDNILFVTFPQRRTDEHRYHNYQISNAVGELIESYGYDFINLESMIDRIGIQPETDFYNNDHMNLYGQYKTTRFLCEILKRDYGIGESQLSALSRERWETCVEYGHLFYELFDYEFKTREPEEFGLFLQENAWLINKLEEIKANGLDTND